MRSETHPPTTRDRPIVPSPLSDGLRAQALGLPLYVEAENGRVTVMPWETGRLHMLLADHPLTEIEVPEWAMGRLDYDVLTGRAWPVPILPPRPAPTRRGGVTCEQIVEALVASGCRPIVRGAYRWRALCPVCRMRGKMDRRVYVTRDFEAGRDRLSSFCHCDEADIMAALGLVPWERADGIG